MPDGGIAGSGHTVDWISGEFEVSFDSLEVERRRAAKFLQDQDRVSCLMCVAPPPARLTHTVLLWPAACEATGDVNGVAREEQSQGMYDCTVEACLASHSGLTGMLLLSFRS